MSFKKFSPFIPLFLGCIVAVVFAVRRELIDKDLKSYGETSKGRITKISRGRSAAIFFHYTFCDKKGKVFSNLAGKNLPDNLVFVGKFFPVLYNPTDPEENSILMKRNDFEAFDMHFPDSLSWMDQY